MNKKIIFLVLMLPIIVLLVALTVSPESKHDNLHANIKMAEEYSECSGYMISAAYLLRKNLEDEQNPKFLNSAKLYKQFADKFYAPEVNNFNINFYSNKFIDMAIKEGKFTGIIDLEQDKCNSLLKNPGERYDFWVKTPVSNKSFL